MNRMAIPWSVGAPGRLGPPDGATIASSATKTCCQQDDAPRVCLGVREIDWAVVAGQPKKKRPLLLATVVFGGSVAAIRPTK
ncbi:MAG: hypothetical protein DRI90_01360 [Deltaproteobacteria bacterium]|nr:MAG: hypothetical protein DRI90_01360 [Deltaproteobacteria bacterium]